MKRLIVAGIILILILLVCITGNVYVENSYKEISLKIEQCKTVYNTDSFAAVRSAETVENTWNKKHKVLLLFVNRDTMDDIEHSIFLLKPYAENNSDIDFYSQVVTAKVMVNKMHDEQKVSFESIF